MERLGEILNSLYVDGLKGRGLRESSIHIAGYDWRLSIPQLEERDGYFTGLQLHIERLYKAHNNTPVTLLAHSLGCIVTFYFLQWVSHHSELGGDWVSKHLHAFVNIAGPLLGAPKALTATISGSTSEVAEFGLVSREVVEKAINNVVGTPEQRVALFRSWGSLSALMPRGGSKVWGFTKGKSSNSLSENMTTWISRTFHILETPLFFLSDSYEHSLKRVERKLCADQALAWVSEHFSSPYPTNVANAMKRSNFSSGNKAPYDWQNPLITPLPRVSKSSSFRIYNLYGFGIDTEASYHFYKKGTMWCLNSDLKKGNTISNGIEFTDG
jgi:phospholipid:diacylglycerol acyltransferase